jgi:hypothetical protein
MRVIYGMRHLWLKLMVARRAHNSPHAEELGPVGPTVSKHGRNTSSMEKDVI